ncbi:MAG: hypothetical protein FJ243_00240 [Nitrospira sp.]|nr:hypothetical protein [Nitrospira sp.]
MDKKDIFRLAKDPRYISGIYNYCDRWCERCPFTSRCLNYAIEEKNIGDRSIHDSNNEVFWQGLRSIFQETIKMITELAEERGIDLNSMDIESAKGEFHDRVSQAENHELTIAARGYSKMVDRWLRSEYSLFERKEEDLNTMLKLGIGEDKPRAEAASINDAVEVIRWYQHLIHVKLMRAIMQESLFDDTEGDDTFRDSDGSAKVALIGMDRSIGAWGRLREHFPEKTDSILDILLHLDRLRRKAECQFPNARNFIRPGFDNCQST